MFKKYISFKITFLFFFFLIGLGSYPVFGQEKPNILFLVIEDTSPYLFPAYGNQEIKTPNIDYLAEHGVTFNNAFSNAPYCSPARSSLISGSYATSYGSDWHRNDIIVPGEYFFPQYLREGGYFTVNAGKTDYNVTREIKQQYFKEIWDKQSGYTTNSKKNATYNDPERHNKPFFAQFNNNTTHMSRMTSVTVEARDPLTLDSSKVVLPPHVPDLPEMRADYALHLEGVQNADQWVGEFIKDLKERELLENTIIFFFSDHGGCLPRGKAFPFVTGMKAGLIIFAPEKWQHYLPSPPGSQTDQIVEFADFGPTLLSLADVDIPEHMQGKAFMGDQKKSNRRYGYGFRTNTSYHFDPSRTVFDENFQYIKYYISYKRHVLKQSFQWGMPSQTAWDQYYLDGDASDLHASYYEVKPKEMLFDMKEDPFGLKNLADHPDYQDKVQELRNKASEHLRNTRDLGFFPRDVRDEITSQKVAIYDWVRDNDYDLDLLYNLVERASNPSEKDEEKFVDLLRHSRPEIRFWATSGLAYLARQGSSSGSENDLVNMIEKEDFGSVKAIAGEALTYMGESEEGLKILISEAQKGNKSAISSLENLGELAEPVLSDIENLAANSSNGGVRFGARSILINFGKMEMSELFGENRVKGFLKNHYKRIENWKPTLPH